MIKDYFKFTTKDTNDGILYSCQTACSLENYFLISWYYKGETSAVEYTREQVTEYINLGLWVIVGEINA